MIIQFLEAVPWLVFAWALWRLHLIVWWCFKVLVSPHNDFSWLGSCDHHRLLSVACHSRHCSLVRLEFKFSFACVFDWTECNSPIPVSSFDDMIAIVHDQYWHIEFLYAPVDLIDAIFSMDTIEFLFSVTSKREWCAWVHIMWPWKPHEVLYEVILRCANNFLIINKFSEQYCLLVNDRCGWLLRLLLLSILRRLPSRHWLKDFESCN